MGLDSSAAGLSSIEFLSHSTMLRYKPFKTDKVAFAADIFVLLDKRDIRADLTVANAAFETELRPG